MRAMWVFVAIALVHGSCARQDWIDRTLVTVDVTRKWSEFTSSAGGPRSVFDLWLELEQKGINGQGIRLDDTGPSRQL